MALHVGVIGSRRYPRPDLVAAFIWRLAMTRPGAVVVTGGAHGPDAWAAHVAGVYELPEPDVIKADWKALGKAAGMLRNSEIVKRSDVLFAFWDLKSHGTADTIRKAKAAGKSCLIYGPDGQIFKVNL